MISIFKSFDGFSKTYNSEVGFYYTVDDFNDELKRKYQIEFLSFDLFELETNDINNNSTNLTLSRGD